MRTTKVAIQFAPGIIAAGLLGYFSFAANLLGSVITLGEVAAQITGELLMSTEVQEDYAARIMLEPLLTTKDLQHLLNVDRRTVMRLVKRGNLPRPFKLGGNRWRQGDIAAVIENRGNLVGQSMEIVKG